LVIRLFDPKYKFRILRILRNLSLRISSFPTANRPWFCNILTVIAYHLAVVFWM